MVNILTLPWADGLAESQKLLTAFGTAIATGDGSGATTRVPMISSGLDVVVFVVFTLGLTLLNWGVRLLVVAPLARVLLHGPKKENLSEEADALFQRKLAVKVDKFSQSALEAIFYGAFSCFGAVMVTSQPWVWPSQHWWIDFDKTNVSTGFSVHASMTDAVACYYIMYAARYAQGMVSVCLEHKRKDFWEMELHHAVTCLLVTLSYVCGWNRVGLVVMLVLDPADVPLHVAKLCKYTGERRCPGQPSNAYQLMADGFFVVFMLSFFAMRLGMFPYICWSAHVEATRYFPKGAPEWTAVGLLYVLLALQVFWGYLLVRVLVKLVVNGHVEDDRSDDEADAAGANAEKSATKKKTH